MKVMIWGCAVKVAVYLVYTENVGKQVHIMPRRRISREHSTSYLWVLELHELYYNAERGIYENIVHQMYELNICHANRLL